MGITIREGQEANMLDAERIKQIGEREGWCGAGRKKMTPDLPRRNEVVQRATEILSHISMFTSSTEIVFVDYNRSSLLLCKEVGEITIDDILGIAMYYTVGRFDLGSCKDEPYVAAYCRKLDE